MKKTPICLIVDDSAPRVHVYRSHSENARTPVGTPLVPDIPNDFLDEFCALSEKENLRGKFSIVPMAGCRGDIIHGFSGFPDHEISDWIDTVKKYLTGRFSFCPEMLTHHKAVNLRDGTFLPMNEMEWAASQKRDALADYIEAALRMLRDAEIRAVGVTSPWSFGIEHEHEYAAAVSDAVYRVWQENLSWYCLRSKIGKAGAGAWVEFQEEERRCISIPTTTGDVFWSSIDTSAEEVTPTYLSALADRILTEDGKSGALPDALAIDALPSIYVHWQSLFSNGSRAGLKALGIAVARINRHFGDILEWTDCETLAKQTI